MMNTRLKIICILFGVIYFYMMGKSMYDEIHSEDFKIGFEEGRRSARGERYSRDVEFYVLPISSGKGQRYDYISNLNGGDPTYYHISHLHGKIDENQISAWFSIVRIFFTFLIVFPLLFMIIYIPVQIYKIIHSVLRNQIFDLKNVHRCRRIGYFLLFISVSFLFMNLIDTLEARAFIKLEDFKIVFRARDELFILFMGIITLLFTEILKISHSMREEQSLTI